jgi:Holliday junction resolvase
MRRVGQVRRRDLNEGAIVEALEGVGAHVTRLSGKGAPDLLIRFRGNLVAVEVKSGTGKRTDAQEASQWPIVRSVSEALALVGAKC